MATIELQPDAASGKDSYIAGATLATFNFGGSINLSIGGHNVGGQAGSRSLIQFDVGAVSGETIESATLALYCNSLDATYTIGAHRGLTEWIEAEITWNEPKSGVSWSGGAGGGAGDDYAAVAEDSIVNDTSGVWVEWDVTALVQAWADGEDNYGLWLISTDELQVALNSFHSSDYPTAAYRPKLVITTTESGGQQIIGSRLGSSLL